MDYTDQTIHQLAESLREPMLAQLKSNMWDASDLQSYLQSRIDSPNAKGLAICVMGHAYRSGWIKVGRMFQSSKFGFSHRIEATTYKYEVPCP